MNVAALPACDVAGRLGRLRAAFDDAGVDGLLCTDLTSVRYLTGFTGSNATLLVRADSALLVTDGRYTTQAAEQLAQHGVDADVAINRRAVEELVPAVAGMATLGLEAESVTWAAQRGFDEAFDDVELKPTEGLVARLRRVKDDGEVARLQAAASIADEALSSVRDRLVPGVTERELGAALDHAMVARGADGRSFETIVAGGPNGAKPHARPTDRPFADGDLVVIDFGALVEGYHSDMTRTFGVGGLSDTQQKMVDVVMAAQAAGVDAVRPGVAGAEVDAVCRDVIAEAGWADAFVHGTGHGIGLVIHEDPRVSKESDDVLEVGHCVTVEPGVYLPEHGGVRIEDSVVVTADGCRALTRFPKDG